MPAKKKGNKSSGSSRSRKPDTGIAFIATFFSIIGFLIAFITKRDDKYVMFYASQSLVIFLGSVIFSALAVVPFIGTVVSTLGGLLIFVLWVLSWVYALSGEMKEVPIVGELAEKIKL
jgi:uncharacterized membrane protein